MAETITPRREADPSRETAESNLARFARIGVERLEREDPVLYELLDKEYRRQAEVLTMVASSSLADPSALACESMVTMNVTAEGYPKARFHAGCKYIDEIEQLAIDRAKAVFKARYANVQPMSATSANEVVMFSVLAPGDTLLGLYEGVPLTRRTSHYGNVVPDKITLFQAPIESAAGYDPARIREQVKRTVLHEIAHYFGIDDDRLEELGAY